MSKKTRAALRRSLLSLSLVLVLAFAAVGGTIAWLTSTPDAVTNTFTVGKIEITLDEADVDEYGKLLDTAGKTEDDDDFNSKSLKDRVDCNEYKLVPSHTYTKDPTVHVKPNSEACYVFVKVENGIAAIEDNTKIADQITKTEAEGGYGWTKLTDVENVYYKEVDADTAAAGTDLKVFGTFKLIDGANVANYANATIKITAYAIQSDGISGVDNAWVKLSTVAGN